MSYIEFPKLNIRLDNVSETINIGNFSIAWYGIIICFGMVLCMILGMRNCHRINISTDKLLDYLLVAIPSAIVGARLYYVIFSLDSYKDDWLSVFYIWEGGLAIYGGIIGAALAIIIMAKIRKDSILDLFDFAFPYIFLGQAIGRWGNFVNQEAFGRTTDIPWGMTGDQIDKFVVNELGEASGTLVHPTFLYESIWCFIGVIVLTVYFRKFRKGKGEVFALYLLIYGLERAFVEGLRIDSLMIGGLRVSQLISVCIALVSIPFFIDCRKKFLEDEAAAVADEEKHTSLSDIVEQDKMESEQADAEDSEEEKVDSAEEDTEEDEI